MIVVAIIGILAAIAIPNFLQYQMKSRQSEAKTNLQAIKTSEVAFKSERGCYVGVIGEGVVAPVGGTKTTPFTWGAGLAPTAPGALWCVAGGVFAGNFSDIGFKATGNVMFRYGVDATTVAAPGLYTTVVSCPFVPRGYCNCCYWSALVITTLLRLQKPIWMAMLEFQPGIPRLTMALPIVQPVCSRLV